MTSSAADARRYPMPSQSLHLSRRRWCKGDADALAVFTHASQVLVLADDAATIGLALVPLPLVKFVSRGPACQLMRI